ncbi:carbamoyltransferase HypF [Campylobacter sp. 19-13652]|nr:carbamoyltransferase HypF [Campylobacter sp. 19-13652]
MGYKYEISGLVQGVGFRPWLYTLALRHGIFGEVFNDDEGVKLWVFGEPCAVDKFEASMKDSLPPLARIDSVKKTKSEREFSEFSIVGSKSAKKEAPILPDYALCADCEREFYDPTNLRYHYPFINCTNCGPRFSIIRALPYDRANTSMDKFKMCPTCKSEYTDPTNRRYHAQPVSCPNCGPRLSLLDKNGDFIASEDEAVSRVAKLIKQGRIIAIKGLGGFHLVCDATNDNALATLRERKNRPHKPFAIMAKDLAMAQNYASIDEVEASLLTSNLKPIVLLAKKPQSTLKSDVVPLSNLIECGLNTVGVMLAYTGLHLLLFEYLHTPIVATSANVSGEPILTNSKAVLDRLCGVVDYVLDYDRDILSPSDDSIAFVAHGEARFIRTSRGLCPKFISTKFDKKGTFLALGAELKSTFAIYKDGQAILSPYIGDLKNVATFNRYKDILELFRQTYGLEFDAVAGDLHPHFLSKSAVSDKNIINIQHHHAHLLSVLFEYELDPKIRRLGFSFDGTGLGDDGTVWGGEVMFLKDGEYERAYHFKPFLLLGGEASIKNISHIAYSILKSYGVLELASEWVSKNISQQSQKMLDIAYSKRINSPLTSSLGRIFDAVASLVFGLNSISFEAQSGMMLEAFYDADEASCYEFNVNKNGEIDFLPVILAALKDSPKTVASGLINGLSAMMVNIAKRHNLEVVLSGGVFQNATLLRRVLSDFDKNGIKYYAPKLLCANDSGVAAGQLYYILINF